MNPERHIAGSAGTRRLGAGAMHRFEMPLLAAVPGLAHFFTAREGDPGILLRAAAGRDLPIHALRQVHGATVRIVGAGTGATASPPAEGDALATRATGIALSVRVADCVPVLLADPRSGAIAAVHAGWRGTVQGVLRETIRVLRGTLRTHPGDLQVGIGPCIGPCCFEVGEEVVDALLRFDPEAGGCVRSGARSRMDLVEANRRQALAEGVRPGNLGAAGLCTRCTPELASFRRDGAGAGRTTALIAWMP
ncbi:MAG: peptidoglycan editing factor PgeF [Candidatus Polarisedimenticolia bacterium]